MQQPLQRRRFDRDDCGCQVTALDVDAHDPCEICGDPIGRGAPSYCEACNDKLLADMSTKPQKIDTSPGRVREADMTIDFAKMARELLSLTPMRVSLSDAIAEALQRVRDDAVKTERERCKDVVRGLYMVSDMIRGAEYVEAVSDMADAFDINADEEIRARGGK